MARDKAEEDDEATFLPDNFLQQVYQVRKQVMNESKDSFLIIL